MRVGFVEWPDGLEADDRDWQVIAAEIEIAGMDVLITNELPFGKWIASGPEFDEKAAARSVDVHRDGLRALGALPVHAIVTSRPVRNGARLVNEAVVLEGGAIRPWRRKRYFPEEPGWFQSTWYRSGMDDFPTADVAGLKSGVLLCTEAMFNERARRYGRAGAELIAIPRATSSSEIWPVAGRMAAIVSGSYVVSSNRRGQGNSEFGGGGFAFAPDGALISSTTPEETLRIIELDRDAVERQQRLYPCYLTEVSSPNA